MRVIWWRCPGIVFAHLTAFGIIWLGCLRVRTAHIEAEVDLATLVIISLSFPSPQRTLTSDDAHSFIPRLISLLPVFYTTLVGTPEGNS
jgi:hypothetical protein